jgi:tetratricopeptide (TPR) repeat protein
MWRHVARTRRRPSSPETVDASPGTVPLAELDRLWDFDDPTGSERRFAALTGRARSEDEGRYLAEALTQLARSLGLQGRFDEADATLAEAETSLREGDRRGHVRLLLERGRVANSAGRGDRGRGSFASAWDLARSAGEDALAVDAAHMLGIVEPGDVGREWNERAMELARTSPDERARRWIGSIANNMGWAHHADGDDDDAIALFEMSRDAFLADGRPDRARIARWSIARCLRSRGDLEDALREQQALLAELDALGEADGYVHEEIGECLLSLGRPAEARPSFLRAHELLADEASLAVHEPERLERLRRLGAA